MDQMSILKQNSPLWLGSICTCMETWTTMDSMKVRYKTRLWNDMGKKIYKDLSGASSLGRNLNDNCFKKDIAV